MSASTTDKITDVRNGGRPVTASVNTGRTAGANVLVCDALTNWPTLSKVHGVTYQKDANNDPVPGTQLDFSAVVSGNSLVSFTVLDGTDTGNAVNDAVQMLPTASWGQDLSDALNNEHSRTGTHKAITATSISTTAGATLGTDLSVAGNATVTGNITVTGNADFKANSLLKGDMEKPHVGGLLFAAATGRVFNNIQNTVTYDTAYTGTTGITANTTNHTLTIARDGLYQISMHFQCIDVATSNYITWLNVTRGAFSFYLRRQDQAIQVGQGDTWSFTLPLLAGDVLLQQDYSGSGGTRFGASAAGGTLFETNLIMGYGMMVAEIR